MNDGRHSYLIVMRNTAFWIVGPFPDQAAINAWGQQELENGGDPRWQVIQLYPRELVRHEIMPVSWHPHYNDPEEMVEF